MRGLPGCGKSTLAEDLKKLYDVVDVLSTDDFWGPEYNFDPSKIGEAHAWNLRRWIETLQMMQREDDAPSEHVIVCANTNIHATEIAPYWATAAAYGYEPMIMQLDCPVEVSLARNVHNVPEHVIRGMAAALGPAEENFPPWWTVEHV
jgi:predicted kinase